MDANEIMCTAYQFGVKANIYLTLMEVVAWAGMVINIALITYLIISEVQERRETEYGRHRR